ncbi:MAG: DEAD/DEAH box helicase [Candidatus Parvarchaeota archaeon]|nr:DEAD/DEAH box helicase [Candidatus Rehaiarchaeum fermentans]
MELSSKLKSVLKEEGIEELTEIQKLVIPKILAGEDIIFSAPTGYGKTLAAFIPCLEKISPSSGLQMIYITPLRSLNRQIFNKIIEIANKLDITVDLRHGDTSSYERQQQNENPGDIMITTPETLQSIFLNKKLIPHLKNIRFVVVDEVQSFLESKRGEQLNVALERLRRFAHFQVIGISATLPNVEEALNLIGAKNFYKINSVKNYDIKVIYPRISEKGEDIAKENKLLEVIGESINLIINEINKSRSCIIFTNTRETAEMLGNRLKKILNKEVEVHHSSISKEERSRIESDFREGKIKVLVATSSMELGIDVGNVDLVIQYMSPRQVIKLMQRVGRSNHNFSGIAKGIIITVNLDDYAESLAIKEFVNKKLENISVPKLSYDVLTHQLVGLVLDGLKNEDEIFNFFKKCYCYKDLTREMFNEAYNFAIENRYIIKENNSLKLTTKGRLFYAFSVSTIPDNKVYLVIDSQTNSKLGVLDEEFVSEIEENEIFIIKGEAWQVSRINPEKLQIYVVRAKTLEGSLPSWEGELLPVEDFIAIRAANIKKELKEFNIIKAQEEFGFPDENKIIIERLDDYIIIHSVFGSKINETLNKYLSSKIMEITGESVISNVSPYRIIIKSKIETDKLISILKNATNIKEEIIANISRSSTFQHRFLNVCRRLGIISKEADLTKNRLMALIQIYKDKIPYKEALNEIIRDKLDLEKCIELIEDIKKEKKKLVYNEKVSPFSYMGFENLYGNIIIKPEESKKALLDLTKERLLNTELYFRCMRCGYKIGKLKVRDAEGLVCPNCGAKYIACFKLKKENEYNDLLDKYFSKKKISEEEQTKLNNLKTIGNLFLGYDYKAAIVSAAYGIGPITAKHILSSYLTNDDNFIEKIVEAERNFIETKDFWN